MQIRYLLIILLAYFYLNNANRKIPQYEINLDLPPKERFKLVAKDFKQQLLNLRQYFLTTYSKYIPIIKALTYIRYEDPEMQAELEGISEITGIETRELQAVNWQNEFGMIRQFPLFGENQEQFLMKNCIGIIAKDHSNGTIYHGRNLDFDWADRLATLLFDAVFTKNGKEIFRSTQFFGYQGVLTGMRTGAYAVSVDTRFAQSNWENVQMGINLLLSKTLNAWGLRKILENTDNFSEAVLKLSTLDMVTNQYFVISGVSGNEGVILARSYNQVKHKLELNDSIKYIMITNYDFWNNDTDEEYDPRRLVADAYLRNQTEIQPQTVFDTISQRGVKVGGTTLQLLMSSNSGYYNTSSPYSA